MNDHTSHNNQADFLFVHYQDDNPQNRSNSLSRQKAVFAQKAHHRKKRLAAVERLKSSTITFCQQLPFVYNVVPLESSGLPSQEEKSRDVDSTSESARAGRQAPHRVALTARQMKDLCSPLSHLGQGFIDPFSTTAVPMSEFMNLYWHHSLNHLLQHPDAIAESITLTIAALRAIEAISCNFDCVATHTKGLNALIQLQGGPEKLNHQTLWEIYQSDIMYAALTNTTPARPLIARWRSEILQETNILYSGSDLVSHIDTKPKVIGCLSLLGTSFFEASWYTSLADTMKTLLRVSQRLIQYYEKGRLQPSTILPTDNSLFLVLGHGLLSIRYTATQAGDLNEPLRITLFIYLNTRIWNFQEHPIMQLLVNHLQESLLSTTSPISSAPALAHFKNTAPDVLFWILFIAGMAAKGHDAYPWFVRQLVDLAASLGLCEWEMAREVLGGFFYTDQLEQPRGEPLWEQVILTRLDGLLSTI